MLSVCWNKEVICGTKPTERRASPTHRSSASSRCCECEQGSPGAHARGKASTSSLRVIGETLRHSPHPPRSSEATPEQRTLPATSDSGSTAPSSGRRATHTLEGSASETGIRSSSMGDFAGFVCTADSESPFVATRPLSTPCRNTYPRSDHAPQPLQFFARTRTVNGDFSVLVPIQPDGQDSPALSQHVSTSFASDTFSPFGFAASTS